MPAGRLASEFSSSIIADADMISCAPIHGIGFRLPYAGGPLHGEMKEFSRKCGKIVSGHDITSRFPCRAEFLLLTVYISGT